MAWKLSKTERAKKEQLAQELDKLQERVVKEVDIFNEALEETRQHLEGFINAYNEKVVEAQAFVEDIGSDRRSEYDDKSESWQESDRAGEVDEWVQAWEDAQLEELQLELPQEVDAPEFGAFDTLNDLPEEV